MAAAEVPYPVRGARGVLAGVPVGEVFLPEFGAPDRGDEDGADGLVVAAESDAGEFFGVDAVVDAVLPGEAGKDVGAEDDGLASDGGQPFGDVEAVCRGFEDGRNVRGEMFGVGAFERVEGGGDALDLDGAAVLPKACGRGRFCGCGRPCR